MSRLLVPIVLLALLAPAATALARDRADELLVDACRDEHVDGTYSQADYAKALRRIPADTDEYTACRDVVRRAQLAAAAGSRGRSGGGSGGGSSGAGSSGSGGGRGNTGGGSASGSGGSSAGGANAGASAPATPAEQQAISAAAKTGGPVQVAGALVKPGDVAAARHDLPAPVLALVGLIAAAVLGGVGWGAWSRVRARRAG
jgi:cobalamin biosynthesis Mg chelatase CobN